MSSIITFFVAPDDVAAAATAENGTPTDLESATYGNFDAWSSLTEWESVLTNRSLDELIEEGGPDVIAGDDGTPLVLAAPPDLTNRLASVDDQTLTTLAEQWVELRAGEGEVIDDELAGELVTEVARLAASAAGTGRSLYCWIN